MLWKRKGRAGQCRRASCWNSSTITYRKGATALNGGHDVELCGRCEEVLWGELRAKHTDMLERPALARSERHPPGECSYPSCSCHQPVDAADVVWPDLGKSEAQIVSIHGTAGLVAAWCVFCHAQLDLEHETPMVCNQCREDNKL